MGRDGITVMDIDGSSETLFTHGGEHDEMPAWSPDGSKIAFASNREDVMDIYVVNTDGSGETRLTSNAARDVDPAWSPDSAKVAFASNRCGSMQIWVMNADGSSQDMLTRAGANEQPAWSPDGAKIAFVSNRDGDEEIYVMNADGSGEVRLTSNAARDVDPAWSPDGAKIAFASDRDGMSQIYVMNADGSAQTRLTYDNGWDTEPAWSASGARLALLPSPTAVSARQGLKVGAWAEVVAGGDCARVSDTQPEALQCAWCLNPLTPGLIGYVVDGPKREEGITWWAIAGQGWVRERSLRFHHQGDPPWPTRPDLADAGSVAFIGPDGNVWLMKPDGSERLQLTYFVNPRPSGAASSSPITEAEARVSELAWSPKGNLLAYTAEGREKAVDIIDTDGRLVLRIPDAGSPSWSPRGDLIAIVRGQLPEPGSGLAVLDLQGRAMLELPKGGEARWSPDGRRIGYLDFGVDQSPPSMFWKATGMIAEPDTGVTRRVDAEDQSDGVIHGPPTWSPDGSQFFYGDRLFAADGTKIGSLPGIAVGWSPDGQSVLIGGSLYSVLQRNVVRRFKFTPLAPMDAPPWAALGKFAWAEEGRRFVHYDWGIYGQEHQEQGINGLAFLEIETGARDVLPMSYIGNLEPSPDGHHLLFESRHSLAPSDCTTSSPDSCWIWFVDSDGSDLTLLARGTHPGWQPQP